tara:strand:+ start:68 stop:1066 length:999 start_codon:yes stop_codon:yes gene_type:complete
MNKKKILVTGGGGYIGSHTVIELFLSGFMPIIIDNLSNTSQKNINGINKILKTKIPFYNIDCTDKKKMNKFFKNYTDIFACIHFAAYKSIEESIMKPEKYYKNNIGSLETLLKCIEISKSKILIFSSSCTVYSLPDIIPVNENAPFKKPNSPYAYTKQKCELLINDNECSSVCLRYFNPIGSHDSSLIGDFSSNNTYNLVPLVAEVALGLKDKLIINGNNYNTHDGTCVRDYIHVQDLAQAHVKSLNYLIENKGKFTFNVGTGYGLSVLDIINTFEKVNNIKVSYQIGPRRKGDVEKIYSDAFLIKKTLGWKPKKTIEEALVSAYNWQKKNN